METTLVKVLAKDLGREEFTSYLSELSLVTQKAKYDLNHLSDYIKDDKRDTPLLIAPAKSRVIHQPLGAVCIIATWNYPISTLFFPIISAIAAGNCVLAKPSEMTPN